MSDRLSSEPHPHILLLHLPPLHTPGSFHVLTPPVEWHVMGLSVSVPGTLQGWALCLKPVRGHRVVGGEWEFSALGEQNLLFDSGHSLWPVCVVVVMIKPRKETCQERRRLRERAEGQKDVKM